MPDRCAAGDISATMIVRRNITRAVQKKFFGPDGGFVLRLDGRVGSPQPAQIRLILTD
ncbi:hypothetical protein [Bradyrhizobium sp. AUGA SZCCT0274]|uniref:hypothetical protein n=1 Tax=Bradyrhizobium sp. AUGA SZCCT0274 TaxID=2807670 RepID=UPI001BA90EBE|nr:hypothetical protein [Bradyrhizobium sp. AUGA SZCCT0274]